jgi:hypothetical protein
VATMDASGADRPLKANRRPGKRADHERGAIADISGISILPTKSGWSSSGANQTDDSGSLLFVGPAKAQWDANIFPYWVLSK